MAHENNITKSYFVKGKEYFYNTPDPKHKTPDMSLPSEYGKQYDNLEDAKEGAKAISNSSGVVKGDQSESGSNSYAKSNQKTIKSLAKN